MIESGRLEIVGANVLDFGLDSPEAIERTLPIDRGRLVDRWDPATGDCVEVVDASGLWAMPGLIDAGAYPFPPTNEPARPIGIGLAPWVHRATSLTHQWLKSGATTVRSAGAIYDLDLELRPLLENSAIPGPRLLASGAPIIVDSDATTARREARLRIKSGADLLAARVTDTSTCEAIGAVREEGTHARAPVVFAAAASCAPACDVGEGNSVESLDDVTSADSNPHLVHLIGRDEVALASRSGHGGLEKSLAHVILHVIETGWTPHRALRAATRGGALALGRADEIGSLAPGLRADILLLDGNPLTDPGALLRVQGVLLAGRLAYWRDDAK